MTGLNHVTTGIVIALLAKRPEVAIPASFLSHFILDSIPHSFVDMDNKKVFRFYLVVETIAIISMTLACMIIFHDQWLLIGLCAFFAFLPDMLWPFYYNGKLKDAPIISYYYQFHVWMQWSETYRGWLVDGLYFSVLVIFLVTYHI